MSERAVTMNEVTVKDVMTHLVVTLRPSDTITDAAKRLLSNWISGAPVVDGGQLVGIVSEADLMKAFTPPPRRGVSVAPYPLMFLLLRGTPRHEARYSSVSDVMTKNVVTIKPNDSIWEAASLIDRYGVRRLPVIEDEGYVVGIVTRSDLVRCMARSHEERRAS